MTMNDRPELDLQRFQQLAATYGGAIERWPEDLRDAARRFATSSEARAVLAEAARLDGLLDRYALPPVSADTSARMLKAMPWRASPHRRLARWLAGLGLVGIGCAGLVSGALAVAIAVPTATQVELLSPSQPGLFSESEALSVGEEQP